MALKRFDGGHHLPDEHKYVEDLLVTLLNDYNQYADTQNEANYMRTLFKDENNNIKKLAPFTNDDIRLITEELQQNLTKEINNHRVLELIRLNNSIRNAANDNHIITTVNQFFNKFFSEYEYDYTQAETARKRTLLLPLTGNPDAKPPHHGFPPRHHAVRDALIELILAKPAFKPNKDAVKKMVDYLDQNPDKPITAAEISALASGKNRTDYDTGISFDDASGFFYTTEEGQKLTDNANQARIRMHALIGNDNDAKNPGMPRKYYAVREALAAFAKANATWTPSAAHVKSIVDYLDAHPEVEIKHEILTGFVTGDVKPNNPKIDIKGTTEAKNADDAENFFNNENNENPLAQKLMTDAETARERMAALFKHPTDPNQPGMPQHYYAIRDALADFARVSDPEWKPTPDEVKRIVNYLDQHPSAMFRVEALASLVKNAGDGTNIAKGGVTGEEQAKRHFRNTTDQHGPGAKLLDTAIAANKRMQHLFLDAKSGGIPEEHILVRNALADFARANPEYKPNTKDVRKIVRELNNPPSKPINAARLANLINLSPKPFGFGEKRRPDYDVALAYFSNGGPGAALVEQAEETRAAAEKEAKDNAKKIIDGYQKELKEIQETLTTATTEIIEKLKTDPTSKRKKAALEAIQKTLKKQATKLSELQREITSDNLPSTSTELSNLLSALEKQRQLVADYTHIIDPILSRDEHDDKFCKELMAKFPVEPNKKLAAYDHNDPETNKPSDAELTLIKDHLQTALNLLPEAKHRLAQTGRRGIRVEETYNALEQAIEHIEKMQKNYNILCPTDRLYVNTTIPQKFKFESSSDAPKAYQDLYSKTVRDENTLMGRAGSAELAKNMASYGKIFKTYRDLMLLAQGRSHKEDGTPTEAFTLLKKAVVNDTDQDKKIERCIEAILRRLNTLCDKNYNPINTPDDRTTPWIAFSTYDTQEVAGWAAELEAFKKLQQDMEKTYKEELRTKGAYRFTAFGQTTHRSETEDDFNKKRDEILKSIPALSTEDPSKTKALITSNSAPTTLEAKETRKTQESWVITPKPPLTDLKQTVAYEHIKSVAGHRSSDTAILHIDPELMDNHYLAFILKDKLTNAEKNEQINDINEIKKILNKLPASNKPLDRPGVMKELIEALGAEYSISPDLIPGYFGDERDRCAANLSKLLDQYRLGNNNMPNERLVAIMRDYMLNIARKIADGTMNGPHIINTENKPMAIAAQLIIENNPQIRAHILCHKNLLKSFPITSKQIASSRSTPQASLYTPSDNNIIHSVKALEDVTPTALKRTWYGDFKRR
jgi:hypothetical protein